MPEWLGHAITAVLSASFVATVGGLILRWRDSGWAQRRQSRQDEITVLNGAIADLKADRDAQRAEFGAYRAARDTEMAALKSEHTACLIEQERLRGSEKFLTEQAADCARRITHLEAEVARLRGAADD